MINGDSPEQQQITPVPTAGQSCAMKAGFGCLAFSILGIIAFVWIFNMMIKIPNISSYKGCMENMLAISGALDRYASRNDKYPAKLSDLHPDFLEQKQFLHCPADLSSVGKVSYDYTAPAMNAPPSTVLLTCKRHVIFQNRLIMILRKDGKIIQDNAGQIRKAPAPVTKDKLPRGLKP